MAFAEQAVHRFAPASGATQRRGLRHIAHDGERAGGATADQHTPVHGGQFLRFIDHDVPVGPFTVGRGPLRGQLSVVPVHLVEQHLTGDDASTQTGRGQRVFGILLFGGTTCVGGGLAGHRLGIGAQHIHCFVEQRNIGTGQRGAFGTGKCRDVVVGQPTSQRLQTFGMGEQLIDEPWGGHRQPAQVQGLAHLLVHTQQRHRAVQLRLIRRVIKLFGITVLHAGQHRTDKGLAGLVMRLPGALRVRLRLFDISGQHRYLNAANGYCRQSSGNTHACGDGIGHYGGHASVALELGCIRGVDRRGGDAGNQIADGA